MPDVGLLGDPATGVSLLTYVDPSFGARSVGLIGGTSVAAPQMAAMWALVLQASKASASCASRGTGSHPYRPGILDPLLYGFARTAKTYAQTFLPIGYGDDALVPYCPSNVTNCPTSTATFDPEYTANPGAATID